MLFLRFERFYSDYGTGEIIWELFRKSNGEASSERFFSQALSMQSSGNPYCHFLNTTYHVAIFKYVMLSYYRWKVLLFCFRKLDSMQFLSIWNWGFPIANKYVDSFIYCFSVWNLPNSCCNDFSRDLNDGNRFFFSFFFFQNISFTCD